MQMNQTVRQGTKPAGSIMAAVLSLTLGTFAFGMTEFVIMGLLTNVAQDLNISIASAGQLITGYALGVAIGGPVMTVLTLRMPRKQLLCALLVIFIAGNALAALAPNYSVLMLARVLTSLAHGTFFGVSSVIAAGLVSPEKRASAIALMYTGLTVANIVGVPLGTYIGQQFGWNSTFSIVAVLGLLVVAGIILFVPKVPHNRKASIGKELKIFGNRQVLLAFFVTVFGFGGVFTAFTYIDPLLQEITGFNEQYVTGILILFGIGMTVGNLVGGKLADWRLMPSLMACLAFLAVMLFIFFFTVDNKVLSVITIFIWGMASFLIVPGLQMRIMDMAKDAPTMASTANQSAFNLGNAGGAIIGGLAVNGIGLHHVPWIAAIVTLGGLVLTAISYRMEQKQSRETTA
ncbi:MFS transporter [Paenibacillus harenae]|uniref:MFS transporter n=1 Tax=Paenibacillus harenae TaxID=306543 RepID=UPI0027D897C0|nr:MFS transporter [Paenibacillus harenae]